MRGFSGGHSFAGGAVGGLCDLEGGGEMRRARSKSEGRGEPARGLPDDDFEPSAVARGPTGVQTSDGASCDSLARRSSSLFSRGSSVMELSELSSSSREPDVTGARCARCVGGRAPPGGVVRGMGGGGRRGLRRCSAAWMAARAVGDRFSSTGGRGAFCGVGRRLATSCSSSVRDIMSGSRSRTIFLVYTAFQCCVRCVQGWRSATNSNSFACALFLGCCRSAGVIFYRASGAWFSGCESEAPSV